MIAAAALGLWLHRGVLPRRFQLAFALLAVIGVGSAAFHATLRFGLQVLDELPMFCLALLMVFILLADRPSPRWRPAFTAALVAWGGACAALDILSRGRAQFYAFQVSFGAVELLALAAAYRSYCAAPDAAVRRLFRTGFVLYAASIAVWSFDLRCCTGLSALPARGWPNPQLHAWWHVGMAAALYVLIVAIAHERARVVGSGPSLAYRRGVPFVTSARRPPLPVHRS
jgi:dihydroceramidase